MATPTALIAVVLLVVIVAGVAVYSGTFSSPAGQQYIAGAKKNQTNQTHLECVNYSCTRVAGAGQNRCAPVGSSCGNQTNQTHLECVSNTCSVVQGPGSNLCSPQGSSCGNQSNQTYLTCVSNTCTLLTGNGTSTCSLAGAACNGSNGSLPDLRVISLQASVSGNGSNGSNTSNSSVTLSATVKNVGIVLAGASTTRFFVTPAGGEQTASTIALVPGQTAIVIATYQLGTGTYTASADADWFNAVAESNENNNGLNTTFSV
ncbi:MAG: hypothetical protein HY520_04350 [Candidatus Aenigmarchaeota archaeon]|nr:hypothetical protein [Candidatus Aenigmarchaeota archaeon]